MDKKEKKFHQFVFLEKGPVNTALIDCLQGNVFQVENQVIEKFKNGEHEDIPEFLESIEEEKLIIETDAKNWVPRAHIDLKKEELFETGFELHCEEGLDLNYLCDKFKDYKIRRIIFYGNNIPEIERPFPPPVVKARKDFRKCMERSKVSGDFDKIDDLTYYFNKAYNSCWGEKIAVTADGKVRPCIHSNIIAADITRDSSVEIVKIMREKYWELTKDKVEKCKECELRHVCFDCREIAQRNGKDLLGTNPYCNYEPYKGSWTDRV